MTVRSEDEWLPVLLSIYPPLSEKTPTLIYGSQILAVVAGIDVSSKDIDLLAPNITLSIIEEAYREATGLEKMRLELLKTERGRVFTLYYPTDERPIPVEIFTTTPLGDPLPTFEGHIVEVKRWGISFLSLTVEAYAVLEAFRGVRPVTIERFRRVQVNWRSARELAERLGILEELEVLMEAAGIDSTE